MKHILLFLAILIVLTSCSNKLYQSNWKEPTKTTSSFRYYHPDSKIRYNIENDDKHLYVSFDVLDQLTIQKIITTGLRLFVDGSGKKKEKMELQFPVYSDKVPVSELEEYGTKYDQSLQLGKKKLDEMIPTDGYLKFDGDVTPIFNNSEVKGVLVTLKFDSTRSLVYTAKIPLVLLGDITDHISIGFETGGYEMPQTDQALSQADVTRQNQGATAGDRAMGRGGASNAYGINSPRGSTAAGLSLRNSTSYNKFIDPIRFWVTAKLAEKL